MKSNLNQNLRVPLIYKVQKRRSGNTNHVPSKLLNWEKNRFKEIQMKGEFCPKAWQSGTLTWGATDDQKWDS